MVASELGKGRLLFCSSEAFARGIFGKPVGDQNTANLHSNMKSWLVRESDKETKVKAVQLGKVNDLNGLDKDKTVVVCIGNFSSALKRREEIFEFVKKGGGFLVAFRPWFWKQQIQNDTEKEEFDRLVKEFLEPMGKLSLLK